MLSPTDPAFPIQGISPRPYAIFGGSFDPVHWGHLNIALQAHAQVGLERVLWLPAGHPPHKAHRPVTSVAHRLAMLELATAPWPSFVVSDLDTRRPGPSFAAQTFSELRAHYLHVSWFWLLGSDAFATLPRWYCADELVTGCHWLVVPRRQGQLLQATAQRVQRHFAEQGLTLAWSALQMKPLRVSSTQVRQACARGASLVGLVPEAVLTYIATQGLYG